MTDPVEVVGHHLAARLFDDAKHHRAIGNLLSLGVSLDRARVFRPDQSGERGKGKSFSREVILERHEPALATLANSRQAKLAISSQDGFSRVGYSKRMAENQNMIREIRRRRGLTLEQLGALTTNPRTGKPTDLATIQKIETGKRKLDGDWRAAIAEALGVEPDDLVGATIPRRPVRRVPLLGKIAAGNWRAAMEDPLDLIPTTKGGPNTFALVPDGDSMDKLVPHGGIIFCDPDDKALIANSYYAMMRPGGEMTFKQFLDSPPRLAPCSTNPEHKEMLMGEEPLTVIGRIIGYNADL